MATARKLKGFTVTEFKELLKKHNDSLPKVAAEKGVTPRAMQLWAKANGCSRKVSYACEVIKE